MVAIRSALLTFAALTAMMIAPAQAGPSTEKLVSVAGASLPQAPVQALLNSQNEPVLTQPQSDQLQNMDGSAATEVVRQAGESTIADGVKPTGDLASMVSMLRAAEAGTHELECLATGIYFESKSEPLAGQLAVGKVIANRASSGGRFPSTYCGVLFQRGQFSFVRGHSLPSVSHMNKQWQTAVAIAKIVDQGLRESPVGNALFFHARYVSPSWGLKRVASIGNHVFYR